MEEFLDALKGKKAIIWMLNMDESIDKSVNSEVNGIITDYVLKVRADVERRCN